MKHTMKKMSRWIILVFISMAIFNVPGTISAEESGSVPTAEIYDGYDTTSKTQKDTYKQQFLNEDGSLNREALPMIIKIIISSDDDVAKEELEHLYTMGLLSSMNIPIGDKIDVGSWFHFVFTIIFFFIGYIFLFASFLLSTFFSMLLIKLSYSDFLANIFQFISNTLIKGFLFQDNVSAIGVWLLILCVVIAIYRAVISNKIQHPTQLVKKIISLICIGLIGGFMAMNTFAYHQTIQKVADWGGTQIVKTEEVTEVKQKSLVFTLFQQQPFLMRNFAVVKVSDIMTRCNVEEPPEYQYESLLLENGNTQGEESYAIHQGRPAQTGKKHCDNPNLKHRDRILVEFMITVTTILTSVTNIVLAPFIDVLLIFGMMLVVVGYLRPLTALYTIIKNVLNGSFVGFLTMTLHTFIWFLCLPILQVFINTIMLMFVKMIEMMQAISPVVTFFFGLAMCMVLAWCIKNIDKVWGAFKSVMKGMGKFALSGVTPGSSMHESMRDDLLEPLEKAATEGVSALRSKIYATIESIKHGKEDNDEKKPKGTVPKGDEDVLGDAIHEETEEDMTGTESEEEQTTNEGRVGEGISDEEEDTQLQAETEDEKIPEEEPHLQDEDLIDSETEDGDIEISDTVEEGGEIVFDDIEIDAIEEQDETGILSEITESDEKDEQSGIATDEDIDAVEQLDEMQREDETQEHSDTVDIKNEQIEIQADEGDEGEREDD